MMLSMLRWVSDDQRNGPCGDSQECRAHVTTQVPELEIDEMIRLQL